MLEPTWEVYATRMALAETVDALAQVINEVVDAEEIVNAEDFKALVVIGCDTRPTSARLVRAACDGVRLTHVRVDDLGQCTTPMLHYRVRATNMGMDGSESEYLSMMLTGMDILTRGTLHTSLRRACQCVSNMIRLEASRREHLDENSDVDLRETLRIVKFSKFQPLYNFFGVSTLLVAATQRKAHPPAMLWNLTAG